MLSSQDVGMVPAQIGDTRRAGCAVSFELFAQLLGFNSEVILRSVSVDYSRNAVFFYFGGDGLSEIEKEQEFYYNDSEYSLATREGQECRQVVPPAWKDFLFYNER